MAPPPTPIRLKGRFDSEKEPPRNQERPENKKSQA